MALWEVPPNIGGEMKLLKAIIISALIVTIGFVGGVQATNHSWGTLDWQAENPSYILEPTPLEEYLINWELGEEILPYPFFNDEFDCDDAVMYSFLYLKAMNKNLDIKIFFGVPLHYPRTPHVWLLVSDNASTFVYDYGIPIENTDLYKGREISYGQLIYYMEKDL